MLFKEFLEDRQNMEDRTYFQSTERATSCEHNETLLSHSCSTSHSFVVRVILWFIMGTVEFSVTTKSLHWNTLLIEQFGKDKDRKRGIRVPFLLWCSSPFDCSACLKAFCFLIMQHQDTQVTSINASC